MGQIIVLVFNIFELLILARILSTWIQVDPYNPIMRFIYNTTEPFLGPVRRVLATYLPQSFGLDISPIIVLIIAAIVERILFQLFVL